GCGARRWWRWRGRTDPDPHAYRHGRARCERLHQPDADRNSDDGNARHPADQVTAAIALARMMLSGRRWWCWRRSSGRGLDERLALAIGERELRRVHDLAGIRRDEHERVRAGGQRDRHQDRRAPEMLLVDV